MQLESLEFQLAYQNSCYSYLFFHHNISKSLVREEQEWSSKVSEMQVLVHRHCERPTRERRSRERRSRALSEALWDCEEALSRGH